MERITRALELARAQRDARSASASVQRREPVFADDRSGGDTRLDEAGENAGASVDHRDGSSAPAFGDTRSIKLPAVELNAQQRDRERILGPNCTGVPAGSFKMLRTQVLKRLDQIQANTLAVVSSTAGAGKTLTAINLAIAIAADSERSALLVDLDLCNPSVHRKIGHQPENGIEDCLRSGLPLSQAMYKLSGYDKLSVISARGRVEGSSELLRSQRTQNLVRELRDRYANRIVIFDLPPALEADDALAFSPCVQAGLLVVGEGKTKRDDVTRTLRLLHDLPFVGTVLNGSRDASMTAY